MAVFRVSGMSGLPSIGGSATRSHRFSQGLRYASLRGARAFSRSTILQQRPPSQKRRKEHSSTWAETELDRLDLSDSSIKTTKQSTGSKQVHYTVHRPDVGKKTSHLEAYRDFWDLQFESRACAKELLRTSYRLLIRDLDEFKSKDLKAFWHQFLGFRDIRRMCLYKRYVYTRLTVLAPFTAVGLWPRFAHSVLLMLTVAGHTVIELLTYAGYPVYYFMIWCLEYEERSKPP